MVEAASDEVDELLGGEITLSFELTSISSSVIVSIIFDVLRLITLIYCGGATSMKNLAMREFAIFEVFGGKGSYGNEMFCIKDVYEALGQVQFIRVARNEELSLN